MTETEQAKKKAKKISPTQRTLELLRAAGMTCAITERWNQYAKVRQDLFGFIDVLAMSTKLGPMDTTSGLLGVQTTSGANHASRRTKILSLPAAKQWVLLGNRIWVLSWSKTGAKGKKKQWTPRIESLQLGDFE